MREKEKKCSKCGGVKPQGEFYIRRRNNDGLTYNCRECSKKYKKAILTTAQKRYEAGVIKGDAGTEKACRCCKQIKSLTDFGKDRHTRDGLQSLCLMCGRVQAKKYRRANPEIGRANAKKWYKANTEKAKATRRKRTFALYGLRVGQYDELLKSQRGGCAICKKIPSDGKLCIDHCHETGAVRGLLCNGCNFALGIAKDNPETLRRMAQYLDEFNIRAKKAE